ncbi:MAG: SRPBCC domain-containing protein [Terricaulis sp.]
MTEPLTVTMPNESSLEVTRVFNAPARLVWDAHTKPELVKRWLLGPEGWSMPKCEIDLRPGGDYLYGWRNAANPDQYFEIGGTYKEITPHSEIKHSERFNGAETACVMRLREASGRTTMTLTIEYGSKTVRDAAFATGMTTGMEASYKRLDGIAAEAA